MKSQEDRNEEKDSWRISILDGQAKLTEGPTETFRRREEQ